MCVDDGPNSQFPEYKSPLVKGAIYVVSELRTAPNGSVGVALIGVTPPPEFTAGTFSPGRFRLLSEMKAERAERRQLVNA